MSFLQIIYTLLIGPLELFFEVVFSLAFKLTGNVWLSIILLSLAMNILVLPLYRRADAMQEQQRDRSLAMKPWNDHIKKTFTGDERFMMQQAYNRQMGYKPTDALKGSVSLLLEIPFFIAAFHFLSHLKILEGVPFGPIADLGAPDALLQLGSLSLNLLPILMTAINVISAAIYLKGFPVSSKIQTYGIAVIFLVLLYNSPAGLVFYWTLNNIFSLAKNLVYRFAPIRARQDQKLTESTKRTNAFAFTAGCIFIALLVGCTIPLSVVQASPSEFINETTLRSPLWFVAYATTLALGTFGVWFGVFYRLATPRGKCIFEVFVMVLTLGSLINYQFFSGDWGTMSSYLRYDTYPAFTAPEATINTLMLLALVALAAVLRTYAGKVTRVAYIGLTLALAATALLGIPQLNNDIKTASTNLETAAQAAQPQIHLSKDGKNVVVIMLDRAVPDLVPFLVTEKPELKKMLSGFTVYTNTVSYGAHTNLSAPSLFGGSEYRPQNMNERSNERIAKKHDEALKVMPVLFTQNNYDVTVFDPPYAGYQWFPDLSIYNSIPRVSAARTMDGSFLGEEFRTPEYLSYVQSEQERNFFCYGLFRAAPVLLRPLIYESGGYNSSSPISQISDSASRARGMPLRFLNAYSVLENMPRITTVENGAGARAGNVLLMANDTTHEPAILAEPGYEPAEVVNNDAYDREFPQRCDEEGNCHELFTGTVAEQYNNAIFYQDNMAALLKVGQWCEYLKQQGVYDNTRIILVSDHSWPYLFDDSFYLAAPNVGGNSVDTLYDMRAFHCLLMVKDFGSTEFTSDHRFMTAADVPVLAMEGLIENPTNPFTGKTIDSSYKQEPLQYLTDGAEWNLYLNNGYVFLPDNWFTVHEDSRKPENWSYDGLH